MSTHLHNYTHTHTREHTHIHTRTHLFSMPCSPIFLHVVSSLHHSLSPFHPSFSSKPLVVWIGCVLVQSSRVYQEQGDGVSPRKVSVSGLLNCPVLNRRPSYDPTVVPNNCLFAHKAFLCVTLPSSLTLIEILLVLEKKNPPMILHSRQCPVSTAAHLQCCAM